MNVETYALRKGDVIDWDGSPYSVRNVQGIDIDPRMVRAEEWVIQVSEIGVGGERSSVLHTIIAGDSQLWRTVRIRGAKYTASQYQQLWDFEGQVY